MSLALLVVAPGRRGRRVSGQGTGGERPDSLKVSTGRTHAGRISELGASDRPGDRRAIAGQPGVVTTADALAAVMASKQRYTRRTLLPVTQELAHTKYYWMERLEGFHQSRKGPATAGYESTRG